jgi:hypothetical protein
MQVKELIEMLSRFEQTAEVHYSYNYGDRQRTEVAPAVCQVSDGVVEYSDYHQMDRLVTDEEDCYEAARGDYKQDHRKVVVLG